MLQSVSQPDYTHINHTEPQLTHLASLSLIAACTLWALAGLEIWSKGWSTSVYLFQWPTSRWLSHWTLRLDTRSKHIMRHGCFTNFTSNILYFLMWTGGGDPYTSILFLCKQLRCTPYLFPCIDHLTQKLKSKEKDEQNIFLSIIYCGALTCWLSALSCFKRRGKECGRVFVFKFWQPLNQFSHGLEIKKT